MNNVTFKRKAVLSFLNSICFIAVLSALMASPAHAIKKCKDADGKWHYGDIAVRACENSKVTTLSDRGFVRGEKAAPKTEQELRVIEEQKEAQAARQAKRDEEKKQKEFEESEKVRILSVYETEDAIDRQRDNQLYSIDSNIAVHNTFLESMDERIAHEEKKLAKTTNAAVKKRIEDRIQASQENIDIYTKELTALTESRATVVEKFKKEKQLYIELTKDK